jgi:hypothetical protein
MDTMVTRLYEFLAQNPAFVAEATNGRDLVNRFIKYMPASPDLDDPLNQLQCGEGEVEFIFVCGKLNFNYLGFFLFIYILNLG